MFSFAFGSVNTYECNLVIYNHTSCRTYPTKIRIKFLSDNEIKMFFPIFAYLCLPNTVYCV